MNRQNNKSDIEKMVFNTENFEMPYFLYKLTKKSMKVFNTHERIEYMYNFIEKVADKNNLIITNNLSNLYYSSKSRDYVDENIVTLRFNWNIHLETQYSSYFKMFVILKDLLKVLDNDLSLMTNFYNNAYFMTKEDSELRRGLSK